MRSRGLFVVTSHVAPDGDNIGSCIALVRYLRNMGKEAYYVLDDSFPSNLSFLYENFDVKNSEEIKPLLAGRGYILAALDCGDKSRLKIDGEIISAADLLLNIDHHESNGSFGDLNLVVSDASSTCELIYELMMEAGEDPIDAEIATALYTGLCTDTGSFKYESAGSSAFRMAADLLDKGAKKDLAVRSIYQNDSLSYVKMAAEVMTSLERSGEIVYARLTRDVLEKYGIDFNDLEELPARTVSIEGAEVGLLFKEKEEKLIKVSFRSKEWVKVNEIASHFGGGGHIRAAGCTIQGDMETAVSQVLKKTREYMMNHERNPQHS